MQHRTHFDQWLAIGGVYPLPPHLPNLPRPHRPPTPDWTCLRARLRAICDPLDLLAYLGRSFAQPDHACDHTFTRITAYFDQDPQQVLTMFQLFEELDVRCDCEAFFMLRVLTR
jgi:hypothetical protein